MKEKPGMGFRQKYGGADLPAILSDIAAAATAEVGQTNVAGHAAEKTYVNIL